MAITAAEVNKLRKQTNAGMMDCKKALEEANGDFEKAVEVLRKKGQKIAAKRADREASEGCVLAGTNTDNTFGAALSLNCETDFVAKNDTFISLTQSILDAALAQKSNTKEELLALEIENGITVEARLTEQTGVIGEKLEIGAYETLEAPYVGHYIHSGNKLATVVGLSAKEEEAAKNVAMQAAAMNPVALDRDSVDQATIEKELELGREQAKQEGKPENILDKIAEGRLNKFFKENTLTEQDYIKDNKTSVAKYLQSVNKDLSITGFQRVSLGA